MKNFRDPNFERITSLELAEKFIDESVKELKEKIKRYKISCTRYNLS